MTHLVIPDTQVKPGVPTDHLLWIGKYILDIKPDKIIHLGDHWDFPSLSLWDKGKKAMEGRRISEDIKAGNRALRLLDEPTYKSNWAKTDRGTGELYEPEKWLLRGNHEDRLRRAIEGDATLDGLLTMDALESPGWNVVDFLVPQFIDGIGYCHYWPNAMGKPIAGMMETRLKNIGHSFVAGHQQTLQVGIRFIQGPRGPLKQRGLVAGACYLHDEDYMGPQGNAHWRGIVVLHEVKDGGYDLMEVSLDYLCRRYEGVPIEQFMSEKYPDLSSALYH